MNKNNLFKSSNKKVVIAISDEEWDLKKLVDADTGKRTDRDTVCDRVHNAIHSLCDHRPTDRRENSRERRLYCRKILSQQEKIPVCSNRKFRERDGSCTQSY